MPSTTLVPLTKPPEPEAAVQRETGDMNSPLGRQADLDLMPEPFPMAMPVQDLTQWTPIRAIAEAAEFFVMSYRSPLAVEKDKCA
jgi:hypothetical protein